MFDQSIASLGKISDWSESNLGLESSMRLMSQLVASNDFRSLFPQTQITRRAGISALRGRVNIARMLDSDKSLNTALHHADTKDPSAVLLDRSTHLL